MKINKLVVSILVFLSFLSLSCGNVTAQPSPIILSNIELVTVAEDRASITWVSNLPADTKVQWGISEALGEELVDDAEVLYHISWIPGLVQGTLYYYRIGSGDRWSDISSFTTQTAPEGELELSFAFVTDMHYDVDGRNTPNGFMYGDSVELTLMMTEELNQDTNLAFIITGGDLTNTGVEADFQGFAQTMNQLDVDWYPVLGNHDKTNPGWEGWYETHFGRTETYYSFYSGSYHFIILDSAVPGQVQGGLDDTQLEWLNNELDAARETPALIFMHHMTDRTDINGLDEDSKAKLDSILDSHPNVLTVHCGHVHANIYSETDVPAVDAATAAVVSYPIGYSKLNLYETGYTQAFYKLESALEISEESRVRLNAASGTSDSEALGDLEDRSFVRKIPTNHPPVISSLTSSSDTVTVGGRITVSVSASDPDGDPLIYIYESNGGEFEGSGFSVAYIAPEVHGTYRITAGVSDGEYTSSKMSIDIEVLPKTPWNPPANHAPVIKYVLQSAERVAPGESVFIQVTADDDDGDELEYNYAPSGGFISGTGKSVEWRAPDEQGDYVITVWVSDSMLESSKERITISVIRSRSSGDESRTPGFETYSSIIALVLVVIYLKGIRSLNHLK